MSAIEHGRRKISSYVEVFDEVIEWSQEHGPDGDWHKLRRRLDLLSQRVREAEMQREAAHAPDWAYRLEHTIWIALLPEALLPPVLDDLVETLRTQRQRGQAGSGVWAPLDRKPFGQEMTRNSKRASSARAAVLAALKRHASNPSHIRILEGLRALEDLHDVTLRSDPIFDAELLISEGDSLAEALRTLLPPMARRVLSSHVENRFRSKLEGKPINQLEPTHSFWHHKIPGLGTWQPVWQKLYSINEPDPLGIWFVSNLQEIYETWHQEAEDERLQRKESEERTQRQAAAEQERQKREEADRHANQAREREEEELREQREEAKRQAEEEQERHRPKLQEQERKWKAEVQGQREEERKRRLEEIRSRPRPPWAEGGWERSSEARQRRWAESEFEKWRKKEHCRPKRSRLNFGRDSYVTARETDTKRQ